MVELEGFNIEIIDCPIMRENDGLAMSSRNVRLTPSQRQIAPAVHKALVASLEYALTHTVEETKQRVINEINSQPEMEVEYYEIVDSLTMQPIANWDDSKCPVGCITVYCGEVRLIDNIKYNK